MIYYLWSLFFMFVRSRDKFIVRNVRQIIYNHYHICFCSPEINTVFIMFNISYMLKVVYIRIFQSSILYFIVRHIIHDQWSPVFLLVTSRVKYHFFVVWHYQWLLLFMFVSSRDKYRSINIRHIIYNHRRLCLCPPEINTVPVMFDISSMLIVAYVCVFHSSILYLIVVLYHTNHPLSSFFMFVFYRVKYRALIVRHMIYGYHCLCLCLPESLSVSLLFAISSMIFIFCFCVLSSMVCPYCLIYDLGSSLFLSVSTRDKYNFQNVWHIIYDHCYSCQCVQR